jgi:hypothetical protein
MKPKFKGATEKNRQNSMQHPYTRIPVDKKPLRKSSVQTI